MASGVYNSAKSELMKGTHQLHSHTIKVMLMNNSHVFTDTHDVKGDVSANEISGTGYTSGGETLGSATVTTDDTDDEGVFDAADTSWATATFTAYHAVIYNDTVSSPVKPLLCSIDFGGAVTATGATFTITWNAEGIINLN